MAININIEHSLLRGLFPARKKQDVPEVEFVRNAYVAGDKTLDEIDEMLRAYILRESISVPMMDRMLKELDFRKSNLSQTFIFGHGS